MFTFAGTAPAGAQIIVRRVQLDTASGSSVEGGSGHMSDQHNMAERRVVSDGAWEIAGLPFCDKSVADTDRTPVVYQVVVVVDSGTDLDQLVRVVATDGPGPHDPAALAAFTHPRLATFAGGGGGGPTTNTLAVAGTSVTSTVNGIAATEDLTALVQAAETVTTITVGANPGDHIYSNEIAGSYTIPSDCLFSVGAPATAGSPWAVGEPTLLITYDPTGGPTGEGSALWQIVQDGAFNGGTPGTPSWSVPAAIIAPFGTSLPVGAPGPGDRFYIDTAGPTLYFSTGSAWVAVPPTLVVSQDTTHVPDPGLDPSFFPMLVPGGRQAIAAMSPPGTRSAGRVVNGELELPPMPVAQIIDGAESIGMAIAAAGLVANKWNFPWVRTIAVTNPSTSASMIVARPTISASWLTDATNLSICTIITDWGDASVIPATTTYQPDPPGPWFDLDPAFTPSRRDTMGGFTDVINPSPGGAPDWVNGHITGWQNGRQSHAETLRAPIGSLLPGETQNFTVVLAVGVPAAGATGTFIVGDVLFSGFALSV